MTAVTIVMVLVSVGIAGTCAYVAASGYFLASNIMTQFQSIMNNSGGGSSGGGGSNSSSGPNMGPLNFTATNTTVKAWLPFTLNNTGTIGLDIKDLAVEVTLTTSNGTSLKTTTDAGPIPFGSSRVVNITLIDTTPDKANVLANQSIDLSLKVSVTVAFPSSWSVLALTISRLDFGITVPGVRFG